MWCSSSVSPALGYRVTRWRQCSARSSTSSCSSRAAVSWGSSPALSHSPAGSSMNTPPAACRYWRRQQTRSSSSRARTTTAPGCSTTRRPKVSSGWPGRWTTSSRNATSQSSRWRSRVPTTGQLRCSSERSATETLGPLERRVARLLHSLLDRHVSGFGLVHGDVVVGHPATPQRALVDRDQQLALALDGSADQPGEQRVRTRRPRSQLRVRLRRDVVGVHVGRELDKLDEVVVRRG